MENLTKVLMCALEKRKKKHPIVYITDVYLEIIHHHFNKGWFNKAKPLIQVHLLLIIKDYKVKMVSAVSWLDFSY